MSRSNARTFRALRQIGESGRQKAAVEHCDLCSVEIPSRHRHLLELTTRQVACACDGCALRFHDVVGGNYKLIPRDVRALPDFHISKGEWDGLAIPINLAFFFDSTAAGKVVAMYPSPAGPTESLLPLAAWESLLEANPELTTMAPDVEALLVNRVGTAELYYIVPIDVCYQLVGIIRTRWHGLSGGNEVWQAIEQFFDDLARKSTT